MAQWNESRQAMEKSIADFEVKRKERTTRSEYSFQAGSDTILLRSLF